MDKGFIENHAISLLSDSEVHCQIYANEGRLLDFTRGVAAERGHLLRWRSSLKEQPEDGDVVLIQLVMYHYEVCIYNSSNKTFKGHIGTYHQRDNIYWRPIPFSFAIDE